MGGEFGEHLHERLALGKLIIPFYLYFFVLVVFSVICIYLLNMNTS